jgi:hypothetical protein
MRLNNRSHSPLIQSSHQMVFFVERVGTVFFYWMGQEDWLGWDWQGQDWPGTKKIKISFLSLEQEGISQKLNLTHACNGLSNYESFLTDLDFF